MKKLLIALALVVLSGCTNSAVTAENAKPVPSDRILQNGTGSSLITVTRDSGWLVGGGCFVELTVNGKPYARMDTGETVSIKIPPGRYVLGISGDSHGKGLCGVNNGQPIKESSTDIKEHETQKFRIIGDFNSGLDIRPTAI